MFKGSPVLDIDVLSLLKGSRLFSRKRNKRKDIYYPEHHDWCYCFEGKNIDGDKIRVIVSFEDITLLMITVIRLGEHENKNRN